MNPLYANDFSGIRAALAANPPLREAVLALIATDPIAGKVTEGDRRLAAFRAILRDWATGAISDQQAIRRTEAELPRSTSHYSSDNRVFAAGWAERHFRTQASRFYNQAVLELLDARGETECFVDHSSAEQPGSQCTRGLAGRKHRVRDLLALLHSSYRDGSFSREPKIPDHPHCTHVVRPLEPEVEPTAVTEVTA